MRFIWGALPPAERVYKQKICHEAYVLSEPALLAYLRLWLGGPWHFYRPHTVIRVTGRFFTTRSLSPAGQAPPVYDNGARGWSV